MMLNWRRKRNNNMKLIAHGSFCQWETPPVAPFTVQRFSALFIPDLTAVETWVSAAPAALRAWEFAYPYQADIIVQVVDHRNSLVFGHDARQSVVAEHGPDGAWYGTQAMFDALKPQVEDAALVEFLELRAKTLTRKVCPSS